VNFREDGKKEKEEEEKMKKGNFLDGVWVGGRERKVMMGLGCFILDPLEINFSKIERKEKRQRTRTIMDKNILL